MKNITFFTFIIFIFFFSSCEEKAVEQNQTPFPAIEEQEEVYISDYDFKYTLAEPTLTFLLPRKLTEISGLGISEDDKFLVALNDEHGDYFLINKLTGEVEEEREFGSVGDYEGIEIVGSSIYMVQSDGTISEASFTKKDNATVIYKTFLNAAYDVEGLGYDKSKNQLLLACKGKAGKGKRFKDKSAVYGFDLDKKELLIEPVILLEKKKIKKKTSTIGKRRIENFGYSGIAIHPVTNDIYALSSPGKILAVLSSGGELMHVVDLKNDIFKQPEGICFDKNGTLYISTEGQGGQGKIFVFGKN